MTFKVAICAGHGYNTPGKRTPDGEREWSFNDKVARAFTAEILKYEGVEVKRFDDPTGKTDVPLSTRTNGANAWGADIYISFHHNANTGQWGTWTGTETFTYLGSNPKSEKLAACVHPELLKAYGLKDRGLKKANFHIVRETKMPAILVEGGYMDSTIDIKKLRDNKVLANAGIATATGVAKYAGLKKKVLVQPKPEPVKSQPKPVEKPKSHTIEKGDTFGSIAKKYGMSVDDVIKFNPRVKPTELQIGDVIHLIPVPTQPVSKPAPKPTPALKPKVETINGIEVKGTIKIVNLNNFTYIYSKPSDSSTKVGEAHKGKTFKIAGSVPGWFEVIYDGKRSYIKDKYATLI